jgi:altronate hydrolase
MAASARTQLLKYLLYNRNMPDKVLQLDSRDNVLVALTDLKQGELIEFSGKSYTLASNVPAKHKFATQDLAAGANVIMYGGVVGKATKPISVGQALATSNVKHQASDFHEQTGTYTWEAPDVSRWKGRTFLGYQRPDGQVGTRNYWLVVPLVLCENRNIWVLKQAF